MKVVGKRRLWLLAAAAGGCGRIAFDTLADVSVAPRGSVVSLASGASHSCAVLNTGDLRCWGSGELGAIGDGTSTAVVSVPVSVVGLEKAASQVAAGADFSCAILADGTLRSWGGGNWGELGDGVFHATPAFAPVPVQALGARAVEVVGGGGPQGCARLDTGDVKCWGWNLGGQLGNGSTQASATPVSVIGLGAAEHLSAGGLGAHVCAVVDEEELRCWGYNSHGQLGNGTTTNSSSPGLVSLPDPVEGASSGSEHTCAVTSDGRAWCWGSGTSGQLGDGSATGSTVPVPVLGLGGPAVAVSAGRDHTCALLDDGRVQCWGANTSGQLGDGTLSERTSPVTAGLARPAIAIVTGVGFSCALVADHTVTCWGKNNSGQLGNGTTTDTPNPGEVLLAVGEP